MLLELAVGDAYGAGFEYVDAAMIARHNDLTHYVTHPRHAILPGCYTDDTQMSIAVTEALASGEPWSRELLAERFVAAFKRDPREGYAGRFYTFLQEATDGRAFLARIHPDSDKSGAAMRAAPIGVLPTVPEVIAQCTLQARITHDTVDGVDAAVASALSAHYLLYDLGPKARLGDFLSRHVPGEWARPWHGKVGPKGLMSARRRDGADALRRHAPTAQDVRRLYWRCRHGRRHCAGRGRVQPRDRPGPAREPDRHAGEPRLRARLPDRTRPAATRPRGAARVMSRRLGSAVRSFAQNLGDHSSLPTTHSSLLQEGVADEFGAEESGADRFKAQFAEDFDAQRVVDTRHYFGDMEDLARDLAGGDIAVVAGGTGHENVGPLDARAPLHVDVGARPEQRLSMEVRRQAVERRLLLVHHGDVVPLRIQVARQQRPDAPAAHDDDVHDSSQLLVVSR